MLAKRKVVEGIRRTEWIAKTEQEGTTPEGERWRADVLATKGKSRVAIEVQWSRQEGDETLRRQGRYDDAEVRGLWLFRQRDFPVSEFVPAFRLVLDDKSKSFSVLLPSPSYNPKWLKSKDKDEPRYWSQRIGLEDFAEGAVSGRLKFFPIMVHPTFLWVSSTLSRMVFKEGMRWTASSCIGNCWGFRPHGR